MVKTDRVGTITVSKRRILYTFKEAQSRQDRACKFQKGKISLRSTSFFTMYRSKCVGAKVRNRGLYFVLYLLNENKNLKPSSSSTQIRRIALFHC